MIAALYLALQALLLPVPSLAQTSVKDDLGRTVFLPPRVSRVLSLQPEMSRLIVALGAGSTLVGRDDFLARFDHLFALTLPGQERLPVVSAADGFPNLELVMRLDPDVIFASPSEAGIPDMLQKKSGKPVVALSSMGRLDKLMDELRLAGALLGRSDRAAQLTGYAERVLDRLRGGTADLPPEKKPRVYLSFWGSLTRTPVSYEPVTAAGGRNLAQGLLPERLGANAAEVSLERLLAWDPDVILVQGSYLPRERVVTVSGVLEDVRLRSVRAVKDRRVYYTFGYWYWWDPAVVLVEALMLAKLFHPERFRDLDVVREGDAVFKMFYGLEHGFDALRGRLGIPAGPWR